VAGLASNEESSKRAFVADTEVLGIVSGSKSLPAGERGKVGSVAYMTKSEGGRRRRRRSLGMKDWDSVISDTFPCEEYWQ